LKSNQTVETETEALKLCATRGAETVTLLHKCRYADGDRMVSARTVDSWQCCYWQYVFVLRDQPQMFAVTVVCYVVKCLSWDFVVSI